MSTTRGVVDFGMRRAPSSLDLLHFGWKPPVMGTASQLPEPGIAHFSRDPIERFGSASILSNLSQLGRPRSSGWHIWISVMNPGAEGLDRSSEWLERGSRYLQR